MPGTVSGLEMALAKYGTMRRAELIAPAIRFAEQGFVLDQGDADMFATATEAFKADPATAAIFLKHGGQPYVAGDRLVQKDLGATLRQIARGRRRRLLQGPGRRRRSSPRASAGKGILTQADLDQYQTRELAPVECDYRGFHVVSAPPPSSGGVVICEILNILEGYPLKDWGFRSAQAVHVQIEAMRHAYVDRNSYLGDPDFVKNPLERLLDKAYAAKIRAAIDPAKAAISKDLKPGVAAARRQQHDALLDRRRQGQRGRGDLHAERLVRRQGHRRRHRRAAQQRDGRLHRQARRRRTSTAWCRARRTRSRPASGRSAR